MKAVSDFERFSKLSVEYFSRDIQRRLQELPTDEDRESILQLASVLRSGRPVVFITGAGLSYASGITPYRYSKKAIWSNFVVESGMRKSFKKNPDSWWNNFWLRTHEKAEFLNALPNPGHYAIASILRSTEAFVITQNIDCLHTKSGIPHDRLVEIHGRLGLYKCVNQHTGTRGPSSNKRDCPFSRSRSICIDDLDAYAINNTSMSEGNLRIRVPRCPGCLAPIMPQALMFDEQYVSHDFYQYPKAERWMKSAAAFIFVGTSFSVNITQDAMNMGMNNQTLFFNFNVHKDEKLEESIILECNNSENRVNNCGPVSPDYNLKINWIVGQSEITLPLLADMLTELLSERKPNSSELSRKWMFCYHREPTERIGSELFM